MQLKEAKPLTTLAGLTPFIRTVARQLYREAVRLDLEITGPICWQYTGVDGKPDTVLDFENPANNVTQIYLGIH